MTFQDAVKMWMSACFSPVVCADRVERGHRLVEEALELAQSVGCTADEAHLLVDYVFGRPPGEIRQEVGGVAVTLAALCVAVEIDMSRSARDELARCWDNIEKIREKHANKPRRSPLPGRSA